EDRVAAPGPGTFHRIDEAGHDHGEGQEGPELHALGDRSGDNRHGGGHEDDLEEEVGCARVDRAAFEAVFTASKLAQHCSRVDLANAAQEEAAVVHDLIATDQVHDAGDREQTHVLGENFGCVLGSDQTRFEHRESGGHPHDQSATDQEVKGVHGVLQLKYVVFHKALRTRLMFRL